MANLRPPGPSGLALTLLEEDMQVNGKMAQAFKESEIFKDKRKDALEIAHWVAEYIDETEGSWIELKITKNAFAKIVKLIKEAKDESSINERA